MPVRRRLAVLVVFALACLASGAALPSPASAAVDLVTTLSASPSPAVPGDTLTVSVTARNAGDTPATAAYIGLVMLDDVTLAEGAECVNFLGRLAVCSIGTLAPGATVTRQFTFNDLKAGELRFQGNASSDRADGNPDNNAVAASVEVEPRADLKLGLDVSRGATRSSSTLVATVRNSSTGPARASRLQVDVSKGLDVGRLPQLCTRSGQRVTCDLGTIESGATATRSLALRSTTRRTYSLVGGVTWARRDATPADNQAQALLTTLYRASVVSLSRLVRGVPRAGKCVNRQKLNIRARGNRLRRVDIYVAGRRVRHLVGRATRKTVHLRALPRRAYTVRAQIKLLDKRRMIGQRLVVPCSSRR